MDIPVIEFTAGVSEEELEKSFSEVFPNLRIRLVRAHDHHKKNGKNGVHAYHPDGRILIDGNSTVREVIDAFSRNYNLTATIYRLTGNTWIPVKQTQDWSLNEQNSEGMDI